MPLLHPPEYAEDARAPNPAARTLFEAFRRQLPDEYGVFHHRAWLGAGAQGGAGDGVADFVIAHPRYGLLVIDAHPGGIGRDPGTGRWYTVDLSGRRLGDLPDPIERAERKARSLRDRLSEIPASRGCDWSILHAVAFPEIVFDERRPAVPAEVILDRRGLDRLVPWMEAAFRRGAGRAPRMAPPGEEGLRLLASLLGGGFEIRPVLAAKIAEHEREIARLTAEQFLVLEGLAETRRAIISGCAGSGKTMLAMEKVCRLADLGYRPLYVCFNILLRDSVAARLRGWPNAAVNTFHDLCEDWMRRAGIPFEKTGQREFWDRTLPEGLLAAAEKTEERFDAVVVDEGQDFDASWWKPLQATLREDDAAVFYIFHDDNQRLYAKERGFPPIETRFTLTRNCRNVRRIHELVRRYYKAGHPITSTAPEGERPELILYRRPEELLAAVERTIGALVRDQGVSPESIAVLTGHGKEKSRVWAAREFGGCRLATEVKDRGREVFWSSVHAFKGLDRPVVVLAEIEPSDHTKLDRLLYVGCSRARSHLVVIASEPAVREAGLDDAPGLLRREE
ncbi:MAG: ATP-binding domain-containing protein [Planctomycetes bacterium]|nr:ATP-binding domain-containing protein [Planctomycetota bacterium]